MTVLLFALNQPPELFLPSAIGIFLAVLLGMTVHEFAHNYVAHLMGDPMPQRWGRLTLNPLVHIYPPGFLMFVIIGFGPLGSAPIDPARIPLKNRRWGFMAAVAAGPISNLLLAIAFALVLRVLTGNAPLTMIYDNILFYILYWIVVFNLLLFIFNLLPLFPIDGWHIVLALLPPSLADEWQRQRQFTYYLLLFMIFVGFVPGLNFSPLGLIIQEPLFFLLRLVLSS